MLHLYAGDICHQACGLGLSRESQEGGKPTSLIFGRVFVSLDEIEHLQYCFTGRLQCFWMKFMSLALANHRLHQPHSDVIIPCSPSSELAST